MKEQVFDSLATYRAAYFPIDEEERVMSLPPEEAGRELAKRAIGSVFGQKKESRC